MMENRNYLIINVSELNKIDFEQICENSIGTLRYSSDGSKTFIKWENNQEPDFISALITKEGPYNQIQILEILSSDEWISKEGTMN